LAGKIAYSLRDLYPEMDSTLSTREATQPESSEQEKYTVETAAGTPDKVIQPKRAWSFLGVLILIVLFLIVIGKL
jgi:hypothetical protein